MTAKESAPYEVRNKEGEVLRSGRMVKDNQSEILINRGKGERLWVERNGEMVEVGAYASKEYAVPTEQPDLSNISQWRPWQALGDDSEPSNEVGGTGQPAPFSAATSALTEPIQASFLPPKGDNQGAPGEHGQYSGLFPQPIDIIESWKLGPHEANILKYLARYELKGGREDLEKIVWYANRLIDYKYGSRSL